MIKDEGHHTGWFQDGYAHGYGSGNLFTGEGKLLKTGWYERQGNGSHFREDEQVGYDKNSATTKEFDFKDKDLIVPFENAKAMFAAIKDGGL